MPANGRWDLIRRLKVNDTKNAFFILGLLKTFLSSAPAVEAFYSNISKLLYLVQVQNLFTKRCGS